MFRTHHKLFLCLLACAFLSVLTATHLEGASTTTYQSTASEVRLTFVASDENRQNISSLRPNEFAVVDNERVIRQFRSFSRSAQIKLDVAIVVDSSQSVLPYYKDELAEAVKLVSQLQSAGDRLSVVSFSGSKPVLLCSGDCQKLFSEKLQQISGDGLTPLFDAVVMATNQLARNRDPDVRPILIVFSDGNDTISRLSANDAIQKALASEVLIYAVDLGNPKQISNGALTLKSMSGATGGRYLPAAAGANEVLNAILEDLRSAYIVTYRLPDRSAGFHSVHIFPTRNLSLTFRCRSGYYYPAAQDSD